ncbi:MAG: family 20 glycosylhydrolase, partial [Blastocatellia bacterium]
MTTTVTALRLLSAALIVLTQIPFNGTVMATDRTAIHRSQSESNPAELSLMPVPESLKLGDGRLAVTPQFKVAITGQPDLRLEQYVRRAIRRLQDRTAFRIDGGIGSDSTGAALVIEAQAAAPATPSLDTDESYSLEVSSTQAVIKAATSVGAMRASETFLQLLTSDHSGYYIPVVSIQDKPRFRWRGLLIDVGRHFEPVGVIKRNLDAMAAVKLNVFHWHLTDDQGFRSESRKYPELTREGSDGLFYTQDEMRDVINYAADRGIRVIPEFDMPGHLTSLVVSHPELASGPGPYSIERNAGIFYPALDPANDKVYK